MSDLEKCPKCNIAIYVTHKMTISWLHVMLVLMPTAVLVIVLFCLLENGSFPGAGGGKLMVYLILVTVGLIGYIFGKYVKKQRFKVQSCTRCDFKLTTKVNLESSLSQ